MKRQTLLGIAFSIFALNAFAATETDPLFSDAVAATETDRLFSDSVAANETDPLFSDAVAADGSDRLKGNLVAEGGADRLLERRNARMRSFTASLNEKARLDQPGFFSSAVWSGDIQCPERHQ